VIFTNFSPAARLGGGDGKDDRRAGDGRAARLAADTVAGVVAPRPAAGDSRMDR